MKTGTDNAGAPLRMQNTDVCVCSCGGVHAQKHSPRVINVTRGVPCINVSGGLPSDNGRVGKSQTDFLQSGAINRPANKRQLCPAKPRGVHRRARLMNRRSLGVGRGRRTMTLNRPIRTMLLAVLKRCVLKRSPRFFFWHRFVRGCPVTSATEAEGLSRCSLTFAAVIYFFFLAFHP